MSFVVTLYSASLSFFHLQYYFSFNSFLYLRLLLFQMKSLPVDVYKNVTYKKHVILFCSLLSVHKQFWAILSKKCCKKRWVRFGKWGHINGQGGGVYRGYIYSKACKYSLSKHTQVYHIKLVWRHLERH